MSSLNNEVELEKSVRRFREKFHGKIAVDKSTLLMRRYANNHHEVSLEVIRKKDRDVYADDDEDKRCLETDPAVKELGERLRVLPLTEMNKLMFDNAQRNLTPSTLHQFACQTCDKHWWRRVPERKKVSRCHLCKQKYDPVPLDKMWGIGEFHCSTCTRLFRGFGRMDLGSPCYTCRTLVIPTLILPPRRGVTEGGYRRQNPNNFPANDGDDRQGSSSPQRGGAERGGQRRQNPHSCLAEDCYNRQEPHVPGSECVHPRSRERNRKPQVVNPSPEHDSTGSTVKTCLSQGSLENVDLLIMDEIKEENEEEEGYRRAHSGSSASSSSS